MRCLANERSQARLPSQGGAQIVTFGAAPRCRPRYVRQVRFVAEAGQSSAWPVPRRGPPRRRLHARTPPRRLLDMSGNSRRLRAANGKRCRAPNPRIDWHRWQRLRATSDSSRPLPATASTHSHRLHATSDRSRLLHDTTSARSHRRHTTNVSSHRLCTSSARLRHRPCRCHRCRHLGAHPWRFPVRVIPFRAPEALRTEADRANRRPVEIIVGVRWSSTNAVRRA